MRPTQEVQNPEERRRFERVDIAHQSQVLVMDAKGGKQGCCVSWRAAAL